jgi:hypothetical protein
VLQPENSENDENDNDSSASHSVHADAAPSPSSPPGVRTRLQQGIRRPKKYTDGAIRCGMYSSTGEPHNLTEALSDSNWCQAMKEEYDALMENKTWHLVPPNTNRNLIDCK